MIVGFTRHDQPIPGHQPTLNSLLQTPSDDTYTETWSSFHAQHITNMAEALNAILPDHYIAAPEKSLQIRRHDFFPPNVRTRKPDISIFQSVESNTPTAAASGFDAPVLLLELDDDLDDPAGDYFAVVIHQALPTQIGAVVARIELLSPGNKPRGSDAAAYRERRAEVIRSRIPLVEIDYLHEQPSVITALPLYPEDQAAHAYTAAVSDSRRSPPVHIYGWGVDQPLPTILIPLADDEHVTFALDPVYQHTFRAGRWGQWIRQVSEPVRMHTYSAADQARIHAVLGRAASEPT